MAILGGEGSDVGIRVDQGADLSLGDSVVVSTGSMGLWSADGNPVFAVRAAYSDIVGGAGDPVQNARVGEGVIHEDPLFADPEDGDFSLQPGSPAIDTGDPASPCENEPHNADGNCRIDMGHLGNTEHARTNNPPQE